MNHTITFYWFLQPREKIAWPKIKRAFANIPLKVTPTDHVNFFALSRFLRIAQFHSPVALRTRELQIDPRIISDFTVSHIMFPVINSDDLVLPLFVNNMPIRQHGVGIAIPFQNHSRTLLFSLDAHRKFPS